MLRYPIFIDLSKGLVINGCKTSAFVVSMYLQHWADASFGRFRRLGLPAESLRQPNVDCGVHTSALERCNS